MRITIKSLTLDNFKCFRHKEISFSPDVTTISGRNGAGKTTIADAILWCLFGKNTQGQSDFDLKTHDENGKPIPNLDHSVEMVLNANTITVPNEITLKRTLKETWVKKRGSDEQVFKNNTTEYLVNGSAYTAADYKKYISQLIDEGVFKAITNPSYFPSLKWQEQRQFISQLVGNISPEEICGTNNELVEVFGYLAEEGDDIVSYRKHLSYQIKQIKDKLDKIPVRLEEQNKALPDKLDWDSIQNECDKAVAELKAIEEKIISIKSGNGGDVLRETLRNDLKVIQSHIDEIEREERTRYRLRCSEHDGKVAGAGRAFNQLITDQRDIESQISSLDTIIKRCRDTAEKTFKEEQADIRQKWPLTQAKFNAEQDGVCELCGQLLPAERLEKVKEQFNIRTANLKQQLTERADKAKQLFAEAEQQAKEYEAKKAEAEKNLAETKKAINDTFALKQKMEKEPVLSLEDSLAGNTDYQNYLQSKDEAQKKLNSVGIEDDGKEQLIELEAEKKKYDADISAYRFQLSTRIQYDKIIALMDGINEEQKDLVRQLSELERKEDVARSYQDRQNAILEERINEHFSLVQWKMFRTVNNGGDPFDEPYCECYVDGVAYHDGLNQAARLNAGLDIINALCRHYDVSAPIVLDNAESTINIIDTIGQQVRLEVFDSELHIS